MTHGAKTAAMRAQAPLHNYDWWHRALAGERIGGPNLPVHDGVAHPGFYRMRADPPRGLHPLAGGKGGETYRDQPWVPVAIFVHEGDLVATVGGERDDPARIWLWCCKHPVSEAVYREAKETGRWADIDAAIEAKKKPTPPSAPVDAIVAATTQVQPQEATPTIGHNAPADESVAIKDQIETAKEGLKDYEAIKDDDHAARAQSLRARLLELSREADKKREAEKKPHFEAAKAVDARWQPLVKDAKAGADTLASRLSIYLTAKARAAEEERRKAEEAAAKEAKPAEPAPAPPPPQPTQVKGGYGRAAPVKVVKVVTAVTDWDALWGFMKEHPEVRDFLMQLAQRAVDKGHTVPGVTVEEQRKVA